MEQVATKDFNKVSNMTARCRVTRNWHANFGRHFDIELYEKVIAIFNRPVSVGLCK